MELEERFENKRIEDKIIKDEIQEYLNFYKVEKIEEEKDIIPLFPIDFPQGLLVKIAPKEGVEIKEKTKEDRFLLTYFNPELNKKEVIKEEVKIKFNDLEEKVIETSLAMREQNIALDYVFKPTIVSLVKENKELTPDLINKTIERRNNLILEIEKQRVVIEELIKEKDLTKEKIEEKIKKFPPLLKKKIELILKKGVDEKTIVKLLLAEDFFLLKIKALLSSLNPKNIKEFLGALLKGLK